MIVITLVDCPSVIRGDLTKWLQEISTGVFVGQVSARVREELWERVCNASKNGHATMVYSARNEQHLEFRVHNSEWKPIDYDGIKLMLRPNFQHETITRKSGTRFSNESKRRVISRASTKHKSSAPREYAVIDIETTGLDANQDEIIEIAALKIIDGEETDIFDGLVIPKNNVPKNIVELTGLSLEMLSKEGEQLSEILERFLIFVGDLPVLSHNVSFDLSFIQTACRECNEEYFENVSIDTMEIAKKRLCGLANYRLQTLADHFGIEVEHAHRGISDCRTTQALFAKLIEIAP